MLLENIKHELLVKDGIKYELIALDDPLDVTNQNKGIETEITHLLKGFDEDLYLVIEIEGDEAGVYFAYKVGDTGLIVNVADELVYDKSLEILFEILRRNEDA